MKTRIFLLLITLGLAVTLFGAGIVMADRDEWGEDDDRGERLFRGWFKPENRLNNGQYSQLYREE